jgi:hypothetical protein
MQVQAWAHWPTPQSNDTTNRRKSNADHHSYPHDLPNMAEWCDLPARLTVTREMLTASSAGMENGGQLTRHIRAGSWDCRRSGTIARLRQCYQCLASHGVHRSLSLQFRTGNVPTQTHTSTAARFSACVIARKQMGYDRNT